MTGVSTHQWDDCPVAELRGFVEQHVGHHKTCEVPKAPLPAVFVEFARQIIEDKLGYEVDHWRYWISSLAPLDDPDAEWQLKFPHTHGWDGKTLVLYLGLPESGGELVVLDQDVETELECWTPKEGMAAVMSDHAIHGVKAIKGSKHRLTMIAGAYPYPERSTKCRCADQNWVRVTN